MTDQVAALSTFQWARGVLRFPARTVQLLWKQKPVDCIARTIFLHTLATGDAVTGVFPDRLKVAVCPRAPNPVSSGRPA